jgi:hypothetical protein
VCRFASCTQTGQDQWSSLKRVERVKVQISWDLNATKLIMRRAPVTGQTAYQGQKDCQYDEAGHQGYGRATQSALWQQKASPQSRDGDDYA